VCLEATHKYEMNHHLTICRGTSKAVKLQQYQTTKQEQCLILSMEASVCFDAMGESNATHHYKQLQLHKGWLPRIH